MDCTILHIGEGIGVSYICVQVIQENLYTNISTSRPPHLCYLRAK